MRWPKFGSFLPSFGPRLVQNAEEPPGGASTTTDGLGAGGLDPMSSGLAGPPPPQEPAFPNDPSSKSPIQYEQFPREWMGMSQQDNFDGFRLEAGKAVTKTLQASHSLFLGTVMKECGYIYQFGPTFQTEDQRTVLVGRIGLDGGVTARVIKKFLGQAAEFRLNANSSMQGQRGSMFEAAQDYNGKDWCTSLKLAWQGTWILNGAYTQVITPNLHLGGELTGIAVNGLSSIGAVALRYAEGKDILTATLTRSPDFERGGMRQLHGCKMQYVRRVTDRLGLGSEFEYSHPDKESAMRMAYEYTFRQARVQGLIDTAGKISCSVTDFMGFGLSGSIDYAKGDYKFGFMMHVFPQPEGPGGAPPGLG